MKFVLFGLLLSVSGTSFAADPQQTLPSKEDMMKTMMEAGKPGAPHQKLSEQAGNWKYNSKYWESASSKPMESSGTSSFKMILNGRFLQQDIKGEAMGQPYEGMGLIAYDNIQGKYESIWVDSMSTGILKAQGTMDPKTKTLKDKGQYSCPFTTGKLRDFRSDWKIKDKNDMTFTMYGADMQTGKEYKQMEMVYKRVN